MISEKTTVTLEFFEHYRIQDNKVVSAIPLDFLETPSIVALIQVTLPTIQYRHGRGVAPRATGRAKPAKSPRACLLLTQYDTTSYGVDCITDLSILQVNPTCKTC